MRVARFRAARGRAGQIPRFSCSMERCCHVPCEEPLSLHRPGQPCPPQAVPDGCLGQLCQRKEENSLVCAKRIQSPTKTITLCTQMPVAFPTHVATSTSRRFGPSPGHVLAALANRSSSGKSAKPFPLRTLSETPRYHSPRALVLPGKTQPRAHIAMPRAPHCACRERCPGRAVGSIPHALQLPSIAGAKPTAGSWGGCRPSCKAKSAGLTQHRPSPCPRGTHPTMSGTHWRNRRRKRIRRL